MSEQAAVLMAPTINLISDKVLTWQIYQALEKIKPIQVLGSPLHIQVNNGTVTLRGVVATHSIKAQILHLVRRVPGVQRVRDELWV